jgi:hypothetical protein
MAVANHLAVASLVDHVRMRGDPVGDFGLNRLRQQALALPASRNTHCRQE